MDELLNFISDNPYVLIVIFFLLARLFGGKKKAPGADEAGTQALAQKRAHREKKREGIEQRLAEQLRSLGIDVPVAPGKTQPSPQPSEVPPIEVDFASSESAGASEIALNREAASSRAFDFRKAIEEPEEQEYHLTGFGFLEAHGLHAPPQGMSADETPGDVPAPSVTVDADALRQGILMGEVLAPPVSLRRNRRSGIHQVQATTRAT